MSGESGRESLESIDYVQGFYDELSPVHLNYIAALNGHPGVPLESDFDYCELGCGLGETTNVLAASNRSGRFWGIDLSSSHIRYASELAAGGGLSNVRFLAADIEKLDLGSLPQFDFVTMHGLYAWVPESTQRAIAAFVQTKLKPGGLMALSYNCFPGTQSLSIIRRFALDRAAQLEGSLLSKAERIVAELEELRAAEAPLFVEVPAAGRFVEILRDNDKRYVVHELFASGWGELSFRDVHGVMQGIGLEYVGDGETLENFLEHCTNDKFVERIRGIAGREEQESAKDFIHNRCFRRDVYRRPRPGEIGHAERTLDEQLLCLPVTAAEVANKLKVYGGEINLDAPWFERVKELLSFNVLSLGEILDDPGLASYARDELRQGVLTATIGGAIRPAVQRAVPLPPEPPAHFRITPQINLRRIEQCDWRRPRLHLASPVVGSGISISRMESMLLQSFATADPRAAFQSQLKARGLTLTDVAQGKLVDADGESAAVVKIVNAFLNVKLPKLCSLGIVESAGAN